MNRPTNLQNNPKSSHGGSLLVLSLLATTLISGFVLASSTTSADASTSSSATASVTVGSACSLTSSIDTAHTATISPGTYYDGDNNEGIGKTTIKITCNDVEGFALYAIGYTNDTYGTTTLNGTNTGQTIATGTAKSGNTSNWAMKLSTTSTPTPAYPIEIANGANLPDDFTNYHAVPSTYTKVAYRNSGTDTGDNATGSTLTTTYAAYIAGSQPADTYNGKVKYTMVHPASEVPIQPHDTTAGFIGYYPNASGVADTMGDQSLTTTATSATLWASNFKRPGYGFAGWSETFDYSDPTKFHGPNETINFTAGQYSGDNNGLSLYAIWVKSEGSLQNWTGCSSLSTGDVTALTDERDNNTYAVAKLADGNCWMIENLRLDNTAQLTTANTNNPLNNSGTVTIKNSDGTTTNHLSASTNPTQTAWCTNTNSACYDQSMVFTGNTTNPANPMNASNTSTPVYSYGNYYNWYSATAGNGTYSKSSGNTSGDICPAGWHLPTGGSATAEFGALDVAMGGTGAYQTGNAGATQSEKWRSYPNNFVYSGSIYGSSIINRSAYGGYWSSTAVSSYDAYNLFFNSSNVNPGTNNGSKYNGRMVRCTIPGV